ncbi:MAG TPA: undecaprenyldiphospho-muramoylpentapeptide beta-N-acetylglucosaminyltransferase [Candidatus Acidoferrales bacterium]|nr:undecaprenyldiphospho-muramoylpentapeptide beta-N-acetylglucosaminyltransferase [Candidatus Acidoferrales bacterium]
MVKVVFAGGGTGGHLFPAIAIAERLMEKKDVDVMFVGTKNKIEGRVVPQLGYNFFAIWIGGFSRKFKLSNLLLPLKILVSVFQSLKLLLTFKPQVVVGTGGYVSGPVCAAAVVTRTPIILQEHNSYPGVMTRLFAPFAREIHIAFDSSRRYFRSTRNLFLTGSPIRKMSKVNRRDALRFFGLNPEKHTLLVTGGSLGAVRLNTAVLESVDDLLKRDYQLIWQTGSVDFDRIIGRQRQNLGRIIVEKFLDKMEYAYSAADIAVCRAGATTVAELIYFNLPALIVPYPHAAANHQVENARTLVASGAAVMVQEFEIGEKFKKELFALVDDSDRLSEMSKKIGGLSRDDAAEIIAESILRIAGTDA